MRSLNGNSSVKTIKLCKSHKKFEYSPNSDFNVDISKDATRDIVAHYLICVFWRQTLCYFVCPSLTAVV